MTDVQQDVAKVLRECAAEERERPSSGPLTAAGMDLAAEELEQAKEKIADLQNLIGEWLQWFGSTNGLSARSRRAIDARERS